MSNSSDQTTKYTLDDWRTVQELPGLLKQSIVASQRETVAIHELIRVMDVKIEVMRADSMLWRREIEAQNLMWRTKAEKDIADSNERISAQDTQWARLLGIGAGVTLSGGVLWCFGQIFMWAFGLFIGSVKHK